MEATPRERSGPLPWLYMNEDGVAVDTTTLFQDGHNAHAIQKLPPSLICVALAPSRSETSHDQVAPQSSVRRSAGASC